MISGIDLSEKNGKIDWACLIRGDIQFVFIKASEAIDSIDTQFETNIHAARENGFLTGVYHWLHPGLHVGQQLEMFVKTVKNFQGMLPPVVCLETYAARPLDMEKNILAFLVLLEKKTGAKPILYTTDDYWKTHLSQSEWGCDYPLWIDKPGNLWPGQLWPWAGWTFWQSSYQTLIPGIPVELGINWFNGSKEELQKMVIQ